MQPTQNNRSSCHIHLKKFKDQNSRYLGHVNLNKNKLLSINKIINPDFQNCVDLIIHNNPQNPSKNHEKSPNQQYQKHEKDVEFQF